MDTKVGSRYGYIMEDDVAERPSPWDRIEAPSRFMPV